MSDQPTVTVLVTRHEPTSVGGYEFQVLVDGRPMEPQPKVTALTYEGRRYTLNGELRIDGVFCFVELHPDIVTVVPRKVDPLVVELFGAGWVNDMEELGRRASALLQARGGP